MRITRHRLKQIILEEINLDAYLAQGNAPADSDESSEEIGEISEGEGMELVQQVAQVLFDTGVTAAETPEELAMALKGLGKAALYALGGGALGAAAIAGRDAIEKIRSPDGSDEPSQALEEEEGDTLSALIMQAIQEQVEEMTHEND